VVWSPLADRQVDEVVEYIAHDDTVEIVAIRHQARAFDEREVSPQGAPRLPGHRQGDHAEEQRAHVHRICGDALTVAVDAVGRAG
jgi:hypothetical protein